MADDPATKIAMAKRASATMFTTMAGLPPDVQLEAAVHLMKVLFMSHVKPEKRLSMFNTVVQSVKNDIKKHLKTGVVE